MDIVLEGVSKAYGETQVLENLSLRLRDGRVSCVRGPSGCGKTTLLRLLAGLETPDSGTITGVRQARIAMVFQEDRLFERLSAEKNLLLTARRDFSRADARALLAELGLQDFSQARACDLSGGMRRRVALARALAAPAELCLLDEPLTGLDSQTRAAALTCIKRRTAGCTVVYVSHDEADCAALDGDAFELGKR